MKYYPQLSAQLQGFGVVAGTSVLKHLYYFLRNEDIISVSLTEQFQPISDFRYFRIDPLPGRK